MKIRLARALRSQRLLSQVTRSRTGSGASTSTAYEPRQDLDTQRQPQTARSCSLLQKDQCFLNDDAVVESWRWRMAPSRLPPKSHSKRCVRQVTNAGSTLARREGKVRCVTAVAPDSLCSILITSSGIPGCLRATRETIAPVEWCVQPATLSVRQAVTTDDIVHTYAYIDVHGSGSSPHIWVKGLSSADRLPQEDLEAREIPVLSQRPCIGFSDRRAWASSLMMPSPIATLTA